MSAHRFATRTLALCGGLLLMLVVTAYGAAAPIRVQVDGRELQFDIRPEIVSGRTLVPVRTIFEALGAEVAWDGATRTVTARSHSHTVHLPIGSSWAMVGGRSVALDTPARIVNGRTLVPLRFVAEALGAGVEWDAPTRTISISRAAAAPADQAGLTDPIEPATDAAPTLSFSWGGGPQGTEPGVVGITQYGQWLSSDPSFKAGFAPSTGIAVHMSASYRPYYSATGGTVVAIRRSGDQGGTVAIRYGRRHAVVHRHIDEIASDLQEGQIIAPGTRLGYLGKNGDTYSWAVELIELQGDGAARSLPPFDYFDAASQAILERARRSASRPVDSWNASTRSVRAGWTALIGDVHWWVDPALVGYHGGGGDLDTFLADRGLTWLLTRSSDPPPAFVLAARSAESEPGPAGPEPAGPGADESATAATPPSPPPDPWPWVDGVLVQPLPPHAAKVRLVLPAPLERLTFVTDPADWGLGGFGLHAGGHVEGLDHIWLSLQEGTQVGSWADGVVTGVDWAGEEWHITIDYGGGLEGWHGEVKTPLVKAGDRVQAGQPVAIGMSFHPGSESAEFGLYDANRVQGDDESSTNGWVSPFDYLREQDQQAFLAAYRRHIVEPYLAKGEAVGYIGAWEPYLTNRVLIHRRFAGQLPGEWVLTQPGTDGDYPDFLTLLEVDNPYFTGRRVESEKIGASPAPVHGTWTADDAAGRIRFDTRDATYYGIFELSESGPRAKLKLEYQKGSYPATFSERAATYTERSELRPGKDPMLKATGATPAAPATPTATWTPRAGTLALPIDISADSDPATRTQGDVSFRGILVMRPFADEVQDASGPYRKDAVGSDT